MAAGGAESRGDVGAMCGLTLRAAALLPEGDSQRLDLIAPLADFLNLAGRRDDARAVEAELPRLPTSAFVPTD